MADNPSLNIQPVLIQDQMKEAYLDYAMSVIIGRALPDVRDGLKPVHRRILWAMEERAWRHNKAFVKSAKIVGEVIGNFHPHGDAAVYDTMVRMAQEFNMRVPLIDGQGNYGSIDGDAAAAYRYTEARLTRMAEMLLRDIDKETVNFNPNFDETRKEPTVLPAAFPNLLVNGSSGIAVGMATNIPPHNLAEVIAGCEALIDNPEMTVDELMAYIPAPDFPTGGIIMAGDGLRKAYHTGNGTIRIRGKAEITQSTRKKDAIIITELPYQVNKLSLINRIAEHVNNKVIEGLTDIRDESNRLGIRIVLETKKGVDPQIILNQLYKQTQLEISFGINLLAIVDRQPRQLSLKQILEEYIKHRKEVVTRRTQFDLNKAEKRAHILEGLRIALANIDEVIRVIRASRTVDIARASLMATFSLSEEQAVAILEMKLQKLTSLEVQKIIDELESLRVIIADLRDILAKPARVAAIVKEELAEVKTGRKRATVTLPPEDGADNEDAPAEAADGGEKKERESKELRRFVTRQTEISISESTSSSFERSDLIVDRDVVITLTATGFVKVIPLDSFRRQKRGGKGVTGAGLTGDDFPKFMLVTRRKMNILFFTNQGRAFVLPGYELPEASKDARGKLIINYLSLNPNERIAAMSKFSDFNDKEVLVFITRHGILKKCFLSEFANVRKRGIQAINLKKEDELISVCLCPPDQDVLIATRAGNALRTSLKSVREMGRAAAGIIGIRLEDEGDDATIGMTTVEQGTSLVVITEKGYGKRVDYDLFPAKGRGGKGMQYLKPTDKSGPCVALATVREEDELMVITRSSMIIRLEGQDFKELGRAALGVKIIDLKDGDVVTEIGVISDK